MPWSHLWTGKAGATYLERIQAAAPRLADLPFHYEVARPHGFPPSAIQSAVEAMRATYPETDGPGSRPLLAVVDFLQLVGDEPENEQELRIRIGRAAYVLRDLSNRLSVAVQRISSIAREHYKLPTMLRTLAGLEWDTDENGCPINRRILNPDAIIGVGKESGDIEFSADSVSVVVRVPETWDGKGSDAVFATAKGRATGANWSPLHFTGFRYQECSDRGGRMVEKWAEVGEKRERVRDEKRTAKGQAKMDATKADAEAIRSYVGAHPGCSVREARVNAVADQGRRWAPAVALLGPELVHAKADAKTGTKASLTLSSPVVPS